MSEAQSLAAVVAEKLLAEWSEFWVGKWSLVGPTPGESGTLTVSRIPGSSALQNDNSTPGGGVSGHAMVIADPASGQIKQTENYSDGSTEVTYITKTTSGQWVWRQTRTNPDGQQETNIATFDITNGGSVLHNVTNRILAGAALPDRGHLLTRIG